MVKPILNGHGQTWLAEPRRSCGLKVLVVEDHKETAASLALLLKQWGYEVHIALDGLAARGAVQQGLPDVVLLDIALPGIDGYEVAKWIGEQSCDKKPLLVAVTGLAQDTDRRRSAEVGIDLHLVKPVDFDQLRRLLSRFQRIVL